MDPNPFPPTASLPVAISKEDRNWAMAAHLGSFAGHFFPTANILAPLVVWLVKKDSSPFIDDQAKESLNAQISLTIYLIPAFILCAVFIGLLFVGVLVVANFILVIMAGIAASEGKTYRYPYILRLVK